MKKRKSSLVFGFALALAAVLSSAGPAVADPPTGYIFRTTGTGVAEVSTEQAHSGTTSVKLATVTTSDNGMIRFQFAPGSLKLDELTSLSYWEYVDARSNPLDVFIDIWLDYDGDGDADADDYPGYMQAEPYYTYGAAPLDTWTYIDAMNLKWSTYVGEDDPYHAPTIYNFQDPGTFVPCGHGWTMDDWTDSEDFGALDILRIDVRVGYGGTWANFTGYADDIRINDYSQGLEPNVWTKYSENPVVTGSMALDPCVLKESGTYKMWYTHVDNSNNWTIYYADSSDGITWSNQQQVLAPSGTSGAYDEVRVAGPSVINDGGTYKMWFSGRDANALWTIGYAYSSDGTNWTKVGEVLDQGAAGSWDSQMVREPWVIKDGSTYKMWYAGTASWPVFKIGYATSTDGTNWTKHASNPIFTGTSGGWDGFQVYAPSVVLDGGIYHMYFSGTDNNMSQRWSTGYATSSDGVAWTEASRNPVLIPDGTDDSLDYVGAMNDGGTWRMWYSYGGSYAIGLATLTSDTQLWLDPAVDSIPNDNATTKTFTVNIANASNLYGYQLVVTFDKNNLEATAAAFIDTFFANPLAAPPLWNAYIDNANGKVYFARTRQYPDPALNGSGPLATVTFKSKSGAAPGHYKIDFTQSKLSDLDGNVLSHTPQYAWLTLYGTGTLQGSVDLQGRANESGGTVTIMTASGYTASTNITAADGSWSFANIPAGGYQVNVEMAPYLDAQKGADGGLTNPVSVSAGGTTTLSQVKLLGGDADDSDTVDISDAAIIGGEFGNTPPTDVRADINNDGTVDILDLALMGGNYTKVSPVPWP